jgi:type IV pilus assembly protein PilB
MIFGWGKKNEDPSSEEIEIETILFQGALSGAEVDLNANARLAQAGLVPAKELISDALGRRAEMIRVEPKGSAAAVTLYVDGVAYPGERLPKQQALAITQVLKLLAGLDIKQRGKPQSGGIKTEYKERDYHVLIDTAPLTGGAERLQVRMQNIEERPETPEQLGFSDHLRKRIRELTSQRHGVVLVSGSPNSGVSTTAFAVIRSIDAYLYSIFSLANLAGRSMTHITQPDKVQGETYDKELARCIRSEADVIIVDPLHTPDRLKMVFDAAEKVCLVAEYRARDAGDAILQLTKELGAEVVAERLSLVLSQKLIRRLCEECKQAYKPNPKLLQKVGLPPETKVLYRTPQSIEVDGKIEEPEYCEKCGGIGYFGRVGLIEAIETTPGVKELILKGADPKAIKKQARVDGMQSFQSDGLRLVAEGRTSLDELQRAFRTP